MTQPPVYSASGREITCPERKGDHACGRPIPDTAIRCPDCIQETR